MTMVNSGHGERQPWGTSTMVNVLATATIDEYVSIYLSCNCFYCFSYNYSLTPVCLFRSTVLYRHQQYQHVLYQHLCHHGVLPPFKCNRNTPAAATITTGTRSDNGNREMQTTQQRTGTGNSPLASSTTMSTRPLSTSLPTGPSLQVQPEHHSNNYNQNAIRQWWQWQS